MSMIGEFLAWILLALAVALGWMIVRVFFPSVKPGPDWPNVQGVAYVCRTDAWVDSNGEEISEPGIRCVYQVNHKTYTLSLDWPGFWRCNRHEWENVGYYWPKQLGVRVYYDPKNPRRAVVAPNQSLYLGQNRL